ncbi:hypothetical protein FQA39_LY00969 [Lamprigera yunnana]|nr:hypothetical protein FQA39_LY00969 [Lamprigera yunnana]
MTPSQLSRMKVLLNILGIVALAHARPDTHLPSAGYLPAADFDASQFTDLSGIGEGNFQVDGGYSNTGGYNDFSASQDRRHIYFYAAPEEPEYTRLRIIVAPNSQRNTKLVFIKAPGYGGVIPEVISPPSLSEDKTLIYVLVKKPQQDESVTVPAGVGVKQYKPEVFFIKYNNKHEAQSQISGSLQGENVGSNVPDVGSEDSFVSTLDSGNQGHGSGDYHGPPGASGPY